MMSEGLCDSLQEKFVRGNNNKNQKVGLQVIGVATNRLSLSDSE